jgi:hypothetical protein
MVSWETLHNRYGPLLELVRTVVGVVPYCDRYREIWEPAFRTYNIVVPNFSNLPFRDHLPAGTDLFAEPAPARRSFRHQPPAGVPLSAPERG